MIPAAWLHAATNIAIAMWGVPHCGRVHEHVIHAIPASLALPGNTAAYAEPWNCSIFLDDHVLHHWWSVCDAVVHEIGHVTGHHHSKDPNSPMYPLAHPLPQCGSGPS